MSDRLKFEIDIEGIAAAFKEEAQEVQDQLYEAVQALGSMTYAKTVELANEKLKSTREKYVDALSFKEIEKGLWVVSLDEKMVWLEDGKDAGSMVDDLLKNNAKVSKSGERYKVIPFEHSKSPSSMSTHHQSLVNDLKKELKSRGVPFKKIEKNPDGSPRLGKLHSMNVESPLPNPRAKYPIFHGLNIYQRKDESGKIKRDIMTFRIVKESHKNEGKWYSMGVEARGLMDQAFDYCTKEFEQTIMPAILAKYK